MEENRFIKNLEQSIAFILVLAFFAMPASAYAEKISSSDATIKTTPIRSFFTRFVKKKPEVKKQSPEEKSAENNVPTVKGGIVFTMEDCVNFAMQNDPNIKNKIQTQNAQKNAIGIAKSNYFPTLAGGTGYYLNNTKYNGDLDSSINNNYYTSKELLFLSLGLRSETNFKIFNLFDLFDLYNKF